MRLSWLFATSQLIIMTVFLIMFVIAILIGHWIGARSRRQDDEESKAYNMTILGGSLGLLGLILGFTFSMAVARYDGGKAQIVHEANAIGTAYLRSKTLPEGDRQSARDLFIKYTDSLIAHYNLKIEPEAFEASIVELSNLQEQIWSHATGVAAKKPDMVPTGIYLQALNEMIDRGGERLAFIRYRVPDVVYLLVFMTSLMTLGLAGYVAGFAGTRRYLVTSVFAMVIVIVVGIIIDLDRPRRGLVQIDLQQLTDLRQSMGVAATIP